MHAIVAEDPPELPESVPDGLRRIVKRCIEKKPAQRFQSARDLAFALRSFAGLSALRQESPLRSRPPRRKLALARAECRRQSSRRIVFAYLWLGQPRPPADISAYQFHPFAFTEDQEFSGVWSPDGQSVAFVEQSSREAPRSAHLMVQSLDAPAPTQLAATASTASAGVVLRRYADLFPGSRMAFSP